MSHPPPRSRTPQAPFEVKRPDPAASPLVFSSPHSGRHYPETLIAASALDREAIRQSEDAFVDELLAAAPRLGVPLITATYARAWLDLNREPFELDQSMFRDALPAFATKRTARVAAGLGSVARVVSDGQEIYREKLQVAEALDRIEAVHRPYHAALSELLADAQAAFGYAVLIDWHSMPTLTAPGSLAGPDVVLGDRFGAACAPRLMEIVEREFRKEGFRVRRNAPFAGGYTTEHYGRPEIGLHALQVEIDRRLYLRDGRIEPSEGFAGLKAALERITGALVALDWNGLRPVFEGRLDAGFRLAGE